MNYVTDPKRLFFKKKAQKKIREGVRKVSEAVTATMGPNGRHVLYRGPESIFPICTRDGVSVAKRMFLEDAEENLAALTVMQACLKQLRESGDGTTLTCLMSYVFLNFLIKTRKTKQLTETVNRVINAIQHEAIPCDTLGDLINVAYVACAGDSDLARIVADSVNRTRNGIVICERSSGSDTKLEFVEGYTFTSGIEYVEFVNMHEKGNYDSPSPMVLVTDHEIAYIQQLIPFFKAFSSSGIEPSTPLVIVCPDVRDEALKFLIKARTESKLNVVFMKPQGIGREKRHCLLDIAALTNARFVSQESGIRVQDITVEMLGTAKRIVSDRQKTIIYPESQTKKRDRIAELTAHRTQLEEGYDSELIDMSLAKLQGQIAILKIGGHSETEQTEILDRADDAIRACRAALEEGVVRGGGCALIHVAYNLINVDADIRRLFTAPVRKILKNSGESWLGIEMKIHRLITDSQYSYFNDEGIVDPVKVIRTALLNSLSVAKALASVDVTITPIEKKEQ